jgi:hypothetical protein
MYLPDNAPLPLTLADESEASVPDLAPLYFRRGLS